MPRTAALDSGHPAACVLPDVFHLYKGGSGFAGLQLLSGEAIHVIHVNDYPNVPRDKVKDADRVFPGDGVAPLAEVFRDLLAGGFRGTLSIELFNPTYWRQDPKQVVQTALEKTRALLADALRCREKAGRRYDSPAGSLVGILPAIASFCMRN